MKTKTKKPAAPTTSQFSAYQGMFDYFNRTLFGGELPHCLLNFSRHSKSLGFFVPNLWADGAKTDQRAAEISLNPDHLGASPRDWCDTLVHEMCHLWQQYHGTPPRRCYHDWEFARKMESVGLMTSDTGKPGGKRVGQKMSDYAIEGGPFALAFEAMPAELLLPWRTVASLDDGGKEEKERRPKSKFKYQCPCCEAAAWAKAGLNIVCGDCEEEFIMEEGEE